MATTPTVEINLEELADNIKKFADLSKKLNDSKLNEKAILLLIQDQTKLPYHTIKKVLTALPNLEKAYLKKENKNGKTCPNSK